MTHIGEEEIVDIFRKMLDENNDNSKLEDNKREKAELYIKIYKELKEQLLFYQKSDFTNFEEYMKSPKLDKINELSKKSSEINKPFIELTKGNPLKSIIDSNAEGEGKKYFEYVKYFYKFIKDENKIKFDGKGRIIVELNGDKIDDLIEFLKGVDENPVPEPIIDYQFDIDMSSGERAFLGLFSRFYSVREKIKGKNVLIVMDEPEMFMHPEWQRKFINIFIKFSESIFPDKKIQIITTSHSPFMASDLPRENIIMLETYTKDDGYQKIGNCRIKNKKDLKTFGANIHELYKESFFMDSTMGEFALSKIKGVIEDLTTLECIQRADRKLKELEKKVEELKEKGEKLPKTDKLEKDKLEENTSERIRKKYKIEEKKETIKYIIDRVGEKVIGRKLKEKYRGIFGEEKSIKEKLNSKWNSLSEEEKVQLLNGKFGEHNA